MIVRILAAAASIAAPAIVAPAGAAPAELTAEQQKTVDSLIAAGLADSVAYGLLESLTTRVGPRLAGTDAEARARDWAVVELKRLGFEKVRIEPYAMDAWTRVRESAAIASPFPQKLHATALGGSVSTPEGGITAEIARFTSMAELRAAPAGSLAGKIVFVDEKMTRTEDGSGYGVAVAKRSGAAVEGARRGAVAAIIRSIGTDSHRFPHTGVMQYQEGVAKIPALAISNPDADQLARAMASAGGPVKVAVEVETRVIPGAPGGNVVGEIKGRTDEIIVIGGHLDSWDLGTGAVDDGAGVAITAAAAKLVGDLKGRPRRTIRVVFWGAEEVGLLGARAYAQTHQPEIARHVLAAESDFGAGRVWRLSTRFADPAAAAPFRAALAPLGVTPGRNGEASAPDIIPLVAAGVPALSLDQDGSDYFDLHHTADDTLDKVSVTDLRQNVAAWAAMLYVASETGIDFRAAPYGADAPKGETSQ